MTLERFTLYTDAVSFVSDLPAWVVVVVAGVAALAETTIGLGFLVPGETLLVAAAAVTPDVPTLVLVFVVVSIAASTGDLIGYTIGRRLGPNLRSSRAVRRLGPHHWDRALRVLRRWGVWAVVAARFLPVLRTVAPPAAGAARIPLTIFLPASVVGATAWSALHILLGYLAGGTAQWFEEVFGLAGWVVLGSCVALGLVVYLVRRVRPGRRERVADEPPAGADDTGDVEVAGRH